METIALALMLKLLPLVLPALLAWAGVRWDSWVKLKIKNERLRAILLHVDDAVSTAVKAVQQTYLDAIEEGLKDDGQLSNAEKQEAMRRALETAKGTLPPEVLAVLQEMFGSKLDAMLTSKIEAEVRDLKRPVLPVLPGRSRFDVIPGLSRP